MKKLITLGAALALLLFGFITTTEVTVANNGICVCDDLELQPDPYDHMNF